MQKKSAFWCVIGSVFIMFGGMLFLMLGLASCQENPVQPPAPAVSPEPTAQTPEALPDETPVPREWTVLVYMGADNNLSGNALSSLNQMESVALGNNGVTVLALVDRAETGTVGDWSGTRLYEVKHDTDPQRIGSTRLASSQLGLSIDQYVDLNTGKAETVRSFVEYAKAAYPASHYAIIFWGHGTGAYALPRAAWAMRLPGAISRGVILDQTSSDQLCTARLRQGLTGEGVELIGIDASFGASIEQAYELAECANILVASEDGGYGWDYSAILTAIRDSHGTVRSVGDAIVTACAQAFATKPGATISEIDLSKIASVNAALNGFSTALHAALPTNEARTLMRNTFFTSGADFYATPGELFKDLYGLSVVAGKAGYASSEAAALRTALSDAVVKLWAQGTPSADPESNPHGLMVYLVNLDGNGNPLLDFPDALFKDRTVSDPLRFVRDSTWVPDGTGRTGLVYRLWLEAMQ